MARRFFGFDLTSVVWGATSVSGVSDVLTLGRNATDILAYDAQVGGSQYTDLTDVGGAALSGGIITADGNGVFGVYGPDTTPETLEMWLDSGIGERQKVIASDLPGYVRDEDAKAVKRTGGGAEGLFAHGSRTTATAIDLSTGNIQTITLGANLTLSFTGATAATGCSFLLIVTQDATGSRLITWPASVKWSNGTAPVLSTAAAAVDVLTFVTVNNGATWYGFLAGKALA